MIVKGKYVKGGTANQKAAASHLNAHTKYIEHRSRDNGESREDRHLFSKEHDDLDRKEATQEIMEHTSSSVSYHKIVLSPGEDEPVQDWRQWTRDVMADLEDTQDKYLHWFAVQHQNTDHPHVHVVLAGAGENRETGREEAVKLYQEDYQQLRESGREHSEHDFYHQIDDLVKELDRQDDVVRPFGERDHNIDEASHSLAFEQGDHDR